MSWLPKSFYRMKSAVMPVDLSPVKMVADDQGFAEGYESDFRDSATEINAASHNLSMAAHDAKDTLKNAAKFFWHTAKFVFHALETAVQFVAKGVTGTYSNPEYIKATANDFSDMVKDAGKVVDGITSTVTDLVTVAGKGLVATTPHVAKAAQIFADKAGGVIIAGVNYALNNAIQAFDDGAVEMTTFDPDLMGAAGESTIFDQEAVILTGRGSVFDWENPEDSL